MKGGWANWARLLLALFLVLGIGLAAAFTLQLNFAGPTPEEYVGGKPGASVLGPDELSFGGRRFACGGLPSVLDPEFGDYAAAFFGFLIVNPRRFELLPPVVQRFAHAHECGHQSVGYSELAADCYAARLGRKEGWLDARAMEEVCSFFMQSKGSAIHLPGPQRCAAIRRCFER